VFNFFRNFVYGVWFELSGMRSVVSGSLEDELLYNFDEAMNTVSDVLL
jgi:hypothetical protein